MSSIVGASIGNLQALASRTRTAELSQLNSEGYARLDTHMSALMTEKRVRRGVAAASRPPVVFTVPVSRELLSVLPQMFKGLTHHYFIFTSPIASDLEVLRQGMTEHIFSSGRYLGVTVHVGGMPYMHAPYGRRIHCEYSESTLIGVKASVVADAIYESMYKEVLTLREVVGESSFALQHYAEVGRRDGSHRCNKPDVCSIKADYMVFDLLAAPMSQEQLVCAMMQHRCVAAEGFLLFEEQSYHGCAGIIPGTTVSATFHDGLIYYDSDYGRAHFPPVNRNNLHMWISRAILRVGGVCAVFELHEEVGALRRFSVELVPSNTMPDDIEIHHRHWLKPDVDVNGKRIEHYLLRAPELSSIECDVNDPASYAAVQCKIRKDTFDDCLSSALAVQREQMTHAFVRKKLTNLNNRFVVKGTTVEVNVPLQPKVVEVASKVIYLIAYESRRDSSQALSAYTRNLQSRRSADDIAILSRVSRTMWSAILSAGDTASEALFGGMHDYLDRILDKREVPTRTVVASAPLYVDYTSHVTESMSTSWFGNSDSRSVMLGWPGARLYSVLCHDSVFSKVKRLVGDLRYWASFEESSAFLDDSIISDPGEVIIDTNLANSASRVLSRAVSTVFVGLSPTSSYSTPYSIASRDVVVADELATLISPALRNTASLMRERVDNSPGEGIESSVVRREIVPIEDIDRIVESYQVTEDAGFLTTIVDQYRKVFPNVTDVETIEDQSSTAIAPLELGMEVQYYRAPTEEKPPEPRRVYLSKLPGPQRLDMQSTTRNVFSGFLKRNADPAMPKISQSEHLIDSMISSFKSNMCRDDVDSLIAKYRSQPVQYTFSNLHDWLLKATPEKVARVDKFLSETDQLVNEFRLDQHNLMPKGKTKPPLDPSSHHKIAKLQTIIYHDTHVNAFWSALFMDVSIRFESLLDESRIQVGLRGDPTRVEDFLSSTYPYGNHDVRHVQTDISEYDKSQEERSMLLEGRILDMCGMDRSDIDTWFYGQRRKTVKSITLGIKAVLYFQRSSGIATTALGNVIINMVCAAYIFPRPIVATYRGDDGYAVYASQTWNENRISAVYAEIANFTVKHIEQSNLNRLPYFCSCFLVIDDMHRRVYMLPDPIRAVESYSRPLPYDEPKFFERFVSAQDRARQWKSSFPINEYNRMVCDWYSCADVNATELTNALFIASSSIKNFRSLYNDHSEVVNLL